MKITVDTVEKTISILGEDTIDKVFKELEKILPLGEWDIYKIKIEKEFVSYPVYPYDSSPLVPIYPYYNPFICYNDCTANNPFNSEYPTTF